MGFIGFEIACIAVALALPTISFTLRGHSAQQLSGASWISRSAVRLLRLQTLLPIPQLILENLKQPMLQKIEAQPLVSTSIGTALIAALLLVVPVVVGFARRPKQRIAGIATSVACCLFSGLLIIVSSAAA
jgi:hypothetical protein